MSYAKLRGRIRELCGTQEAFASAIGVSPSTLSLKLSGARDWSREEIELAAECLHIPLEEIHTYFFSH